MLLISSAALWFGSIAWVVSAYHARQASLPFECHHQPPAESRFILPGLVMHQVFHHSPERHKAGAPFLHPAEVIMNIMRHHRLDGRLAPLEQLIEPINITLILHVQTMLVVGHKSTSSSSWISLAFLTFSLLLSLLLIPLFTFS